MRDRFYSSERAPRVVWLPCARDSISWFKPFELEAEEVWEKSLLQALREYGVDVSRDHEDELVGLLPAHAREWFDKPKDTWKELTPGNAKGTLVDDHRMLQALAGPPGEFDSLRQESRFDIFARRCTEDFGLPDPQELGDKEPDSHFSRTAFKPELSQARGRNPLIGVSDTGQDGRVHVDQFSSVST